MEISGSYIFEGNREDIFDLLLDPDVIAPSLPGDGQLEQTGEDEYRSEMSVGVGPVSGDFEGTVKITNKQRPERYTLNIEGEGGPGFVDGTVDVTLFEAGENQTEMTYKASVDLGGKLSFLGNRMLKPVADKMTGEALESLDRRIQEKLSE